MAKSKKIRDLPAKKKADKVRGGRTSTSAKTVSPLKTIAKPFATTAKTTSLRTY